MKLNELQVNSREKVEVLVLGITEKLTRNNDSYVVFSVTDGENKIETRMWQSTAKSCERFELKVVEMTIKASMYNGEMSYETVGIMETDTPITNYIPKVPVDTELMWEYLCGVQFDDPDVEELVQYLLKENRERFMFWPAAKGVHHALYGGLLYHTYRMVKMAESGMDVYKDADHDIVKAGAMLHDIGKIRELGAGLTGDADYTLEGRLFGHLYLGMEMVREAGRVLNTSERVIMALMHIIASHHGRQEWGAIAQPQTIEAEIVHQLDNADSRIYQYEDVRKNLAQDAVSDSVFGLGHRVIKF